MCAWNCLGIYKRRSEAALNLPSKKYYDYNKSKQKDVRPTKLADFEGIA